MNNPANNPKYMKNKSCTEQMVWDAIFNQTPFLPVKIDLNNSSSREEIENNPQIKAMVDYVFYEGSDDPRYNDIKRRRCADLIMIASAIMDAVMGDPLNSNPWE